MDNPFYYTKFAPRHNDMAYQDAPLDQFAYPFDGVVKLGDQ